MWSTITFEFTKESFTNFGLVMVSLLLVLVLFSSNRSYFTICEIIITCYSILHYNILFIDYLIFKIVVSLLKLVVKSKFYGYNGWVQPIMPLEVCMTMLWQKNKKNIMLLLVRVKICGIQPRFSKWNQCQVLCWKIILWQSEKSEILKSARQCHDYTEAYLFYISTDKHLTYMVTIL